MKLTATQAISIGKGNALFPLFKATILKGIWRVFAQTFHKSLHVAKFVNIEDIISKFEHTLPFSALVSLDKFAWKGGYHKILSWLRKPSSASVSRRKDVLDGIQLQVFILELTIRPLDECLDTIYIHNQKHRQKRFWLLYSHYLTESCIPCKSWRKPKKWKILLWLFSCQEFSHPCKIPL